MREAGASLAGWCAMLLHLQVQVEGHARVSCPIVCVQLTRPVANHAPNPADYTLTKPNVYYVTMRQLLAWVQNPVPASQLTAEMVGCGQQGGRPGTLAGGASTRGSDKQRRRRALR